PARTRACRSSTQPRGRLLGACKGLLGDLMSNDRNRASSAAPGLALTCVRRPLPAEPGFCRRPLAACLLIALGLGGSIEPCSAGTVIVNRCNDQDGIQYIGHSLRKAINVAQEGDTV